MEICNNVAKFRKKMGYTQQKLSEISNLSQQYISGVERGAILPSIKNAIIISEALGECYCDVFFKCCD